MPAQTLSRFMAAPSICALDLAREQFFRPFARVFRPLGPHRFGLVAPFLRGKSIRPVQIERGLTGRTCATRSIRHRMMTR